MLTTVNIFSIGGNMSNQIYIEIENVKKKIEESLKRYGEYSTELIELYEEIADLYCSLNEFEECRYYLLKVLNIKKHFYGETNIALIKTYDQLATVADEKEEIIYYFSEVIRIKELMYGTKHIETANTYVELANVYVYLAEYDKAEKYYLIALEIYSSKEDCRDVQELGLCDWAGGQLQSAFRGTAGAGRCLPPQPLRHRRRPLCGEIRLPAGLRSVQ